MIIHNNHDDDDDDDDDEEISIFDNNFNSFLHNLANYKFLNCIA